ncbi:MAG: PD40 domain-containing protein, partial [Spirochaetes bacterium]|nr:PD40 domain-containing protein [Spirochaetota bacterium]
RGESYSGTVSRDNKYLYFSSNSAGNYDLYVRDLSGVFSVPVVSSVTNQKEPTISPDGKYLAYVDDELDPDGDIMLLRVKPQNLIDKFNDERGGDTEWFVSKVKNLTNSEKNRVRAHDANPAWSPDGNTIAWSTDLIAHKANDLGAGAGAVQNIWIMPAFSPDEKRQLTTEGGVMPSFSGDGQKIVYISYQDDASLGAIYELVLATGKTRRLTSGKALDFYPSYTPDGSIIFTRIARDTNGDGTIDRKDAGQILRIYPDEIEGLGDDDFIPLTSAKDHVFDSRYSTFVGGSVLLAQLKGEDINVGFIPLSGSVPVKTNPRHQLNYLKKLLKQSKTPTRYCLGLEQLPAAFDKSPEMVVYDAIGAMRYASCSPRARQDFTEFVESAEAGERDLYRFLSDLANIDTDYADLKEVLKLSPLSSAQGDEYFRKLLSDKSLQRRFEDAYSEEDAQAILGFMRLSQARQFIKQGKHKEAVATIRLLVRQHPGYLGSDELLLTNGIADSTTLLARELVYILADEKDAALLPDYFKNMKSPVVKIQPYVRRKAEVFVLDFLSKQFTSGGSTAQLQFLKGYPENKHKALHALASLAAARAAIQAEAYDDAEAAAVRTQSLAPAGSWTAYGAQVVRGQVAEVMGGSEKAAEIYSAAIKTFADVEVPDDVGDIIDRLSLYHQDRIALANASGRLSDTAKEYQELLDILLSAHSTRLTRKVPTGKILDYALSLDQIALRSVDKDEKLLSEILHFYETRMDIARRHLVNEFIFGRGFLEAQLGIQRHLNDEVDGISKSEKKRVFENFIKAEEDLNWCFFADARFADAYIMLGWMYQFIDEKREVVLEPSSGKKDREVFESLYQKYFPSYLFEKNISLYQKTLSLFGKSGSPRVRNSFHLNIANNYFLLNNYAQAEEHYAAMLDKSGNPDYQFETPEQEMMFYYHFGRTLYFTGKNDTAARYLQFVAKNLDARYPLAGVSADAQKLNQERRERAYKSLALNSEYAQDIQGAIAYNETVVNERRITVSDAPISLVYLELARLYLRQGELARALDNTNSAEIALGNEKEIAIPKFKIRIKWFWVYEPWTFLVGLFYKLPYDDVYIGDNHLAFDIPTVNRYQLLHSLRADIYRRKGLLQEASDSLGELVKYAKKDKTKHGSEALGAAVSRRAEIEFRLQNWDTAESLYEEALKSANAAGNAHQALVQRKNVEICKIRKLEDANATIAEKLKQVDRNVQSLEEYQSTMVLARIGIAERALKISSDGSKTRLPPEEEGRIQSQVLKEIQSVYVFSGLNRAHAAEFADYQDQFNPQSEEFSSYFSRKKTHYEQYRRALQFFRGYTRDVFPDVDSTFEPDLRNNSLRIKLAMNRAKILESFGFFEEAALELKEIQEKGFEFSARLEAAIATYRAYRLAVTAETVDRLSMQPYEELLQYFLKNPSFLQANVDLFERTAGVVSERALKNRDYAKAIRIEDLRRQKVAVQMYFNDLKLFGPKQELFSRLLIVEQQRNLLQGQIRSAHLARQGADTDEKNLRAADVEADKLYTLLRAPDRLDYRYDTFFSEGYSTGELVELARLGIIYALKPGEDTTYIYIRSDGKTPRYEVFSPTAKAKTPVIDQVTEFARRVDARIFVADASVLHALIGNEKLRRLAIQTSLRSAINFSANPDRAKRNIVQLTKPSAFFKIGGSNEVNYSSPQTNEKVGTSREAAALFLHRNIVDYEGDLTFNSILHDNALISPGALFALKSNPNYGITSMRSREKIRSAEQFRFAAATDVYFSAMGAGQVLHTFGSRKDAKGSIERFLNDGSVAQGMLLTGNANFAGSDAKDAEKKLMREQHASYLRKVANARKLREYDEAASYAEDGLSLFPKEAEFHLLAAEIYLILQNVSAAAKHLTAIGSDKNLTSAQKITYAKLLLRSGDDANYRLYLTKNAAVRQNIEKNIAISEGIIQLRAFTTGNLGLLDGALPWESETDTKHPELLRQISKNLKDNELRNEICNAAAAALEYNLVIASCIDNPQADAVEKIERQRIKIWFATQKIALRPKQGDIEFDFFHALAFLEGGYITDAIPYAQRFLGVGPRSVAKDLLVFSFLRPLSERTPTEAEERGIVELLHTFGKNFEAKAENSQARWFYQNLNALDKIYDKGVASLPPQLGQNLSTTGALSAANLLQRLALTIAPSDTALPQMLSSGFTTDKSVENELKYYTKFAQVADDTPDCVRNDCSLLVKRFITKKQYNAALRLTLTHQGIVKDEKEIAVLPQGTFGYTELFPREVYEWYATGKTIEFARIAFDEKNPPNLSSTRKYLVFPKKGNLFLTYSVKPPRQAVLLDLTRAAEATKSPPNPQYRIASTHPSAIYSAIFARWGLGQNETTTESLLVKGVKDAQSGHLNIYTDPIALNSLSNLKSEGYHLFCGEGESYNAFAAFAVRMSEYLFAKKMSVEAAYEAAMNVSRGKQGANRPFFYLYKN